MGKEAENINNKIKGAANSGTKHKMTQEQNRIQETIIMNTILLIKTPTPFWGLLLTLSLPFRLGVFRVRYPFGNEIAETFNIALVFWFFFFLLLGFVFTSFRPTLSGKDTSRLSQNTAGEGKKGNQKRKGWGSFVSERLDISVSSSLSCL